MKRVKTFRVDRIPFENGISNVNYIPTDEEVEVFATATIICKKLAKILTLL